MLSTRGDKYAALDLAAGYTKMRSDLYDKVNRPDGFVSLTMAENVRIIPSRLRSELRWLLYNANAASSF
jgi:hypothetical protein